MMRLIYGPVPSWRLGRSLGVDLVAIKGKTCTFDCVYCQLGRTTRFTDRRQVFVDTDRLKAELTALSPLEVDYVTFSGTGEPTRASSSPPSSQMPLHDRHVSISTSPYSTTIIGSLHAGHSSSRTVLSFG